MNSIFLVGTLCQSCPQPIDSAVQLGGDWYVTLETPITFQQASSSCTESNGQLAVIYDQNSHDAIYKLIGKTVVKLGTI
jgi:hypothetical protein